MKTLLLLQIMIEFIFCDVIIKAPGDLKKLFNNVPIKTSLSNFGRIPFGYNLIGLLHYDPDNIDTEMACKNITTIDVHNTHGIDQSPIVMVQR
jgi:hypothetical protein